jgi:hypothetical protein
MSFKQTLLRWKQTLLSLRAINSTFFNSKEFATDKQEFAPDKQESKANSIEFTTNL